MLTKFREALSRLPYLRRAIRMVWEAAPHWTLSWAVLVLLQGILPVAPVYLTRLLVNRVVLARDAGGTIESFAPALVIAGLIAAVLVVGEVLQSVAEWIRTGLSELLQDHISGLVHGKAMEVDVAFYESADYYDRLHRARTDARVRLMGLLEGVAALARNAVTFLAMVVILLPYGAWLPVALIAGTVPAFLVVLRSNRRYHEWWENTTSDRRLAEYDDTVLTHYSAAAELRLFDLGPHFSSAYQGLRRRLREERLSLARDQSRARLGAGAIALIVSGLTMAYMLFRAVRGAATLGDLALFYQAFNQGQGLLRSLLGNVGDIYGNSFFLGNLFEFLGLKPAVVDACEPVPLPEVPAHVVAFRDVTFRYPDSERETLRDFCLELPAGRTTAIVGPNGAGKSTLIKLLCRFYDVEAGRVELDGVDVRDLSLHELRRRITVLFQFPQMFSASVGQNIAMGDLATHPTGADIEAAARGAGAHDFITRLPLGYDTLLGKTFVNGTDLSGGEWQRLALARAFVRKAPIVVLDEPTSFMDSWAEAAWLERFRDLVRGRTVLIITHRFSTARHADVIHVMDGGQIVESGSHEQLVAAGGLYAGSWNTQMSHVPQPVPATG